MTYDNSQSRAAFADGEQANFDGLPVSSNPHKPSSYLFAYWLQGWQAAQPVRSEWEESLDA